MVKVLMSKQEENTKCLFGTSFQEEKNLIYLKYNRENKFK